MSERRTTASADAPPTPEELRRLHAGHPAMLPDYDTLALAIQAYHRADHPGIWRPGDTEAFEAARAALHALGARLAREVSR